MTNDKLIFVILFSLIIIFNSCDRPLNNKSIHTKSTNDTIKNKENKNNECIFSTLDKKVLLMRLFDNPDFDTNEIAIWKPNYYERLTFPLSYDNKCHTAIDTIMYFNDKHDKKYACVILATYKYRKEVNKVSTKIEIGDCHFCGVPIGIVLLSQIKNNEWELYQFKKVFTSLGYFGTIKTGEKNAGKIRLQEIGDKWTCLVLTQGIGGNMGEFSGYEDFYSIEQFQIGGFPNQILSTIFSYSYHYDYTSIDGKVKTIEDSEIKIIKNKNNYYDIDLLINKDGKKNIKHYKYSDKDDQYIEK